MSYFNTIMEKAVISAEQHKKAYADEFYKAKAELTKKILDAIILLTFYGDVKIVKPNTMVLSSQQIDSIILGMPKHKCLHLTRNQYNEVRVELFESEPLE